MSPATSVASLQPVADRKEELPDFVAIRRRILTAVQVNTIGMSKFGAASIRGKAVVTQAVAALKLTPEQEETLDVLSIMEEMQNLTTTLSEADRALIEPMSENDYEELRNHDRAVRKNTRWVRVEDDYSGDFEDRVRHNRRLVKGVASPSCPTCLSSTAGEEADVEFHPNCPVPYHDRALLAQASNYAYAIRAECTTRFGDALAARNLDYAIVFVVGLLCLLASPFLALGTFFLGMFKAMAHRRASYARYQRFYPAYGVTIRKEYADL